MNDQSAAELLNRSLTETLTDQELAELERHLAQSPQSRDYADLAKQIQHSLAESAVEMESGPGLSQITKSRIGKRLAQEIAALNQISTNPARRIAEDGNDYQVDAGQDAPDEQN